MSHKLFFWLCLLLIGLTVGLRLYRVTGPVADWHSWRQSDTAAVARNFLKFGFDPLRPRYDDLSNIQSGSDNPQGYRMVEFPLYQLIGGGLAKLFPQMSVEVWLRAVNIGAATGTAVLIVLIVSSYTTAVTGLLAGLVYAVLPYSIYFGRTILPETFAVFWALLSLFSLARLEKMKGASVWLVIGLGGIFAGIALLVKPTAGFLLVPVFPLLFRKFKFSWPLLLGLGLYGAISAVPLALWRVWILQFPEGIPVYEWLLNSNQIRFKGAWFQWLFAVRLGSLILGYWGLILLGLGFMLRPEKKEGAFFYWWVLGIILYLSIFATGNVQHDYYQILLLPVVSVYVGKGIWFLFTNKLFSRLASWAVLLVSFSFMLAFSWYTIRTFYWINRPEIVEAGLVADAILPPDAKVIASYNGDTSFLYQINRQGWPLGFEIDKKILMGATHYVTVSPTDEDGETRALVSRFTTLVRNDKFAIIDLRVPSGRKQ